MRLHLLVGVVALALGACGGEEPVARPPLMPPTPPAPTVTAAAPAGDPPPVVEGDVTSGTAAGIPVIVERIPGAQFAAGQLVVRGGTRNWTAASAGIEQLAFRVAATGGTRSLDKTAYSRRLASLGAQLGGDTRNDFSELYLKVPVAAWDDAFALLAEVFLAPALPPTEIELGRTQALSQLHHEQEDPGGQLWTLERKQIFAGHPYANRPVGTVESVTALQPQDLAPYLERLRDKGRLLFVAAGDVDPAHVFAQVRAAFGALPAGGYVETPLPPLVFDRSRIVTETRKLPTNYCQSVFPAPHRSDPDYVTALVAIHGLSWRLWQEVRTKRNLTYSVNAYLNDGFAHPFGTMDVTAVDPNAAMKVMLDEARRMQSEPIGDEELAGFKSTFLTGYLEQHETSEGQASSLAEAQIYGGDWRLARALPDRVRAVTAADVQAFARKYLAHLQAAVVGDPSKVDAALFTSL
ncbi:MAG TPA: pitrilysin family protein [Polyangiaceae bacterium]|jgi:zinc protease